MTSNKDWFNNKRVVNIIKESFRVKESIKSLKYG